MELTRLGDHFVCSDKIFIVTIKTYKFVAFKIHTRPRTVEFSFRNSAKTIYSYTMYVLCAQHLNNLILLWDYSLQLWKHDSSKYVLFTEHSTPLFRGPFNHDRVIFSHLNKYEYVGMLYYTSPSVVNPVERKH